MALEKGSASQFETRGDAPVRAIHFLLDLTATVEENSVRISRYVIVGREIKWNKRA